MDLYEQIEKLMNELSVAIAKLRQNGVNCAEAERDYKAILTKTALQLRTADNMPVTLIDKTIYGMPEVADARFKRDVEQANYEANKEYINITKLKLKILEAQLEREWGIAGREK